MDGNDLFSDQELKKMIAPLFLEQLLVMFVGLADTLVISQYIGRQDADHAGESASQLLMFSFAFSVLLGAAVLLGKEAMLRLLFGKVEPPVMQACMTYLRISAYSYPAFAVYNAGAAWPSFFARAFSAVAITLLCFRRLGIFWFFSWPLCFCIFIPYRRKQEG